MNFKSEREIELLRKKYPENTRICLDNMEDPQAPPSGTCGNVICVDAVGQIHVAWENGSGLALNPDIDSFHIIHEND